MRGTSDTGAVQSERAEPDSATSSDFSALTPTWLDKLIRSSDGVQDEADPSFELRHVEGPPATVARIHGAIGRATAAMDAEMERDACWRLSQHLAAQGYDLREALRFGRRALALRADASQRKQLTALLTTVGDFDAAADLLGSSVVQAHDARESALLLSQRADLLMRAGRGPAALDALLQASALWPESSEALDAAAELAASLGMPEAAAMLLESADRHESKGDKAGAFEARRRAFELSPAGAQPVEALVASLDRASRPDAADAILRAHARARSGDESADVHRQRLARALERGQSAAGLAALCDGRMEGAADAPGHDAADELLEDAGLHDVLAMRLLLRARVARGDDRAAVWSRLAGLYTGRLASPDRALDAWIEVVSSAPSHEQALSALRSHSRTMHDPTPLAEALLRASIAAEDDQVAAECLRELAAMAEERLADPSLAHWAYEGMAARGSVDVEASLQRLGARVRLQDGALSAAREALSSAQTRDGRVEALRRMAAILRGRPAAAEEYLDVLRQLVEAGQSERRWWLDFERVARRTNRFDLLEAVIRGRLEAGCSRADQVHFRVLLIEALVARNDEHGALEQTRALMREVPGARPGAGFGWALASLLGDDDARAECMEQSASSLAPSLRATLYAVAGELRLGHGEDEQADRLAELARRADPSAARVVWFLAHLAMRKQDASLANAIEKAWSLFVPDGSHHQSLAVAFERSGDHEAAYAWTRRWFELRPWDAGVARQLVMASIALGRPAAVEEAMTRVLSSVHAWLAVADALGAGLRWLASGDVARGMALARALVDRGASGVDSLHAALLDLGHRLSDALFEVGLAERRLARVDAVDADELLRVAALRRKLGDADGEANALARAAASPEHAMQVLTRLEAATTPGTGDALVWRLQAQAAAVEQLESDKALVGAGAWLRAGAARWDLGGDRNGAMAAWCRAAALLGDRTYARLGAALSRFAGDGAPAALADFAVGLRDAQQASALLVVASALAFRAGRAEAALRYGLAALDRTPSRTDALLIVEQASAKTGDSSAFDKAYERVALAAKGRFGRRAAHYRAARTLESRGLPELAVVHAIAAFEADPVDGAVLASMMRIAGRVDPADVIDALVRVSDRETEPERKAFWLRCAASLAGKSAAHERTGLDLSLRALLQSPSREAVELLANAIRAALASQPDDLDILQMRLTRAARAVTSTLDGPRGARVALDLAALSASQLRSAPLAWTWLNAALACSGDVDEYAELEPSSAMLAGDAGAAVAFVDAVLERAGGMGGTSGPGLLGLAAGVAKVLGDQQRLTAVEAASQALAEAAQPEHLDVFGDLLDDQQPQGLPMDAGRGVASRDEPAPLPQHEQTASSEHEPAEPRVHVEELDPLRRALSLATIGEIAAAISELEAELERDPARQGEIDPHLRKLYASAGQNTKLAIVLQRIEARSTDPQEKLRLLVELAALSEARADVQGASVRWNQVAQLDPNHPDAAAFLERHAVEAGDYDRLAEMLGRRANATQDLAEKKALRMRRAMLMEHRLHRPDSAARELELLMTETDGDVTVLRARAELAATMGQEREAAQFWLQAAKAALSPGDAASFACRAASVYLRMGHERAARDALALAGPVRSPDVLALLVDIERLGQNPVALAAALDELATASHTAAATRAGWLMEAAELAVQSGHVDVARERAARAERLADGDARMVLRRVQVDYRCVGLGSRAEVAAMLARLEAIADRVDAASSGLHTFLSAEAMEALSGRDAAYQLLLDRQHRAPSDALIALGIAERLAVLGRTSEALPYFDIVLAAKDLGVLRTRAQVAFAAARTALAAGGPVLAAPYIEEVQRQPDAGELAERLRREAADPANVTDEMRKQLERVARESSGVDRAKALRQIARTWAARGTRAAMAEADAYYAEAMAAAASDPTIRGQIETERNAFRGRSAGSERPAGTQSYPPRRTLPPAVGPSSSELVPPPPTTPYPGTESLSGPRDSNPPETQSYPPAAPRGASSPPAGAGSTPPRPKAGQEALAPAPTPLAPAVAPGRASEAPIARERSISGPTYSIVEPRTLRPARAVGGASDEEKRLFALLASGDVAAGDRLAELIDAEGGRAHDIVAVRRRQVVLEPTNLRVLGMLRDAALSDHDRAHALAVEHVIDVLSGSPTPVQPPQPSPADEPERLHAMLARGIHTEATEIFGHVWESAPHLFARDAAAFGVTGLERVVLGAPTPVGRGYAVAARTLGLMRVPVFQKRTAGPQSMAIALLNTPAVIVAGELRDDSTDLVYRLASMLAATLPANVMFFGMTGTAVKQLMLALTAAFGPPEASRGRESETAILAGELWRALPGRVQRRMQQMLKESSFSYEELWARALQTSRRAGLFVVADLRVALQEVMSDPGVSERVEASSQDMLRSLCQVSTSAADLVRFATSVEYAQARWRDEAPRRSLSGPGI